MSSVGSVRVIDVPLGGSGGMLPQIFFRFISSEIASGVILNMFTLLFGYSRSRRGASARSLHCCLMRASWARPSNSKRVRLTCTIGCGATSF